MRVKHCHQSLFWFPGASENNPLISATSCVVMAQGALHRKYIYFFIIGVCLFHKTARMNAMATLVSAQRLIATRSFVNYYASSGSEESVSGRQL